MQQEPRANGDGESPPKPPPRLQSQTSKVIPLTPVPTEEQYDPAEDKKPERPFWFRFAYFCVGFTIFGILTVVAGALLYILRLVKFNTGTQGREHYYYFGRRVPKQLGMYLLIGGGIAILFGGLAYHASLIRIDRYIGQLHEYNSKKKRDARERALFEGAGTMEHDPLMEQDEEYYYEQQKKIQG